MPSIISVLCQIKSKELEGGFIKGLASYMIEPNKIKTFHYGFYKKQISFCLQSLTINDYALISGLYNIYNIIIVFVCNCNV
jgi:hypothetical protein